MKLISFAVLSFLAVTVSANPPHNPDTDAMDQSQNDAIQDMEQPHDSDALSEQQPQGISDEEVEELMENFAQDPQEFTDADTQGAQQSQESDAQNMGQPPDDDAQNMDQPPDDDTQDVDQSSDDDIQEMDQHPSAATQEPQQPQFSRFRNTQHHQIARSESSRDHYVQLLQNSLGTLYEECREGRDLIYNIETLIDTMEKELLGLEKSIEELEEDSPDKERMMARRTFQISDISEARDHLTIARYELEDAEKEYDIVNTKIFSLNKHW
ncbi:hypothetical protein BASA61_006940 [Batrachochytrium salamandrivorans]|nr:hypothetical protein BASA61_006940 [Batrachochytrium salamandrivorans]